MTIPRNLSDILMQETIKLYNNIAEFSECRGRLKADLVVFPSPRIEWDYESLGEDGCRPDQAPFSFEGLNFSLDNDEEIHVARSLRSRHIICIELNRKRLYGI